MSSKSRAVLKFEEEEVLPVFNTYGLVGSTHPEYVKPVADIDTLISAGHQNALQVAENLAQKALKEEEEQETSKRAALNKDGTAKEPLCPKCNKPVDSTTLAEAGFMTPKAQDRFCRTHRRAEALASWASSGYPTIDWLTLVSRVEKHHAYAATHLASFGASSYYRGVLADLVARGKAKTPSQALDCSDLLLVPGYYGSRGGAFITQNLVDKFGPSGGDVLQRRAVDDRLIAARGHVNYVQYVLMPEIATRLVMEDRGCSEEKAREILRETREVGELVNESNEENQRMDDDLRLGFDFPAHDDSE